MNKLLLSLIFFLVISLVSFGQTKLFVDPEFSKIANKHNIIAVIPFNTTISLLPKQMANLSEEQLEKMQKDESINIQRSMYSWLLKRSQQGNMWVNVQDVSTTNAILAKNGMSHENLYEYTPSEIAKVLKVDAVIKGNIETSKPMSNGESLVVGALFGFLFFGSTNQATINMFIHNADDGKVLVNYNKLVAGSIGSSADQLINIVMRKASRRIPYNKPKV